MAGYALAVLAIPLISYFSWRALQYRSSAVAEVRRTVEALDHLESGEDFTSFRAELPRETPAGEAK